MTVWCFWVSTTLSLPKQLTIAYLSAAVTTAGSSHFLVLPVSLRNARMLMRTARESIDDGNRQDRRADRDAHDDGLCDALRE